MLTMASGGFAFAAVARNLDLSGDDFASRLWRVLAYQFDHVRWVGCAFWDLIQPSFMFMVGVALPYSYASRKAKGDSETRIFVHTVWRALLLVALGVFLSSNDLEFTHLTLVNVLSQIGLGYVFVYLLRGRGLAVQFGALAAILVGYTALFATWPAAPDDKDWKAVGVEYDDQKLEGWHRHWAMNANPGHEFDLWLLNLVPQPGPPPRVSERKWQERGFVKDESGGWHFVFNAGGYQTLNFVPSLATMILGLMVGEMLRRPGARWRKLLILLAAAAVCLAVGWALGQTVCPLVKRIWTPTWAIFSTGWTLAMLAGFYGVIDVWGWRKWAFPLVVVGMNSIAMYMMAQLLKGWVGRSLSTHGMRWAFAGTYGPVIQATAVLFVLWLACLWMYRRKVFLRI